MTLVLLSFDALGDLVLRQGLFRGLLDGGHRVVVVVRPPFAAIVSRLDRRLETLTADVDPYRPLDEASERTLAELSAAIAALEPDAVVAASFDFNFADAWLFARLSSLPRVGFSNRGRGLGRAAATRWEEGGLLTDSVDCSTDLHESEKNAALLSKLAPGAPPPGAPSLELPEADLDSAARLLASFGLERGRYAIACPAASVNVPLKAWPASDFVDIAAHLHDRHGLPVLITGHVSEAAALEGVAEACRGASCAAPLWLGADDELGALLGLVALSRLYVGSDTGPMHFAAALDVPVVARFTGAHWPRFHPLARRSFVATQKLPCFGCAYDCWLTEPLCSTLVAAGVFRDALDWILSDAPDEQRVSVGEPLGPVGLAVVEKALGLHRRNLEAGVTPAELELAKRNAEERLEAIEKLTEESRERADVIDRLSGELLELRGRLPVRILGRLRMI